MHRFLALAILALASSSAFAQIHLGLFNDFQDGSLMGWGGPNAFNNSTGGPNGAGDRFLDILADGSGQGGALASFNTGDWIGNYQAAGVTSVTAMFKNFNSVQLEMRIVLFDGITHARWTSTNSLVLAANSGWTQGTFSLAEADLTRVQGSSNYTGVITNVERIMFRHNAGSPSAGGTSILGEAGIDNIRAVPEPASLVALGFGALALLRRRRSR